MVIKVFFSVLVLCTAAVVAVTLAIHLRVQRHLRQEAGPLTSPASGQGAQQTAASPAYELVEMEQRIGPPKSSAIEGVAGDAAEENRPSRSSRLARG